MFTLLFAALCGRWKHLEEGMWGLGFFTGVTDLIIAATLCCLTLR